MKKWCSFVLILGLLVMFVSCAGAETPVEQILLAARDMKIDVIDGLVTEDTKLVTQTMLAYRARLDETETEVLRTLYSRLQYTIGEETESAIGRKTLHIKLTLPDMVKIRSLADAQVATLGISAAEAIRLLISDGTVDRNLVIREMDVVLEMESDEWKIPYSGAVNADLIEALYLADMLRFVAQH